MAWEETKHNFGPVKRGSILRYGYVVKNIGTEPLVLQKANLACSCTTVEMDLKPILPGQSSTLTLVFNTGSVYGRQDRIAEVLSNAPGPPARLRYKALVSQHQEP